MGQQQIRVVFPLRYKLLISVLLLLLSVIAFLTLSTAFLIKEDKRAYLYETQGVNAQLAGKQFQSLLAGSLDTLRLALSSVDPEQAVAPKDLATLNGLMGNQSTLAVVEYYSADLNTASLKLLARIANPKVLERNSLPTDIGSGGESWIQEALPRLTQRGFAFFNASRPGTPPLLCIALGDVKIAQKTKRLPLAIGFLPLSEFAKEVPMKGLSIADQSGALIFDTDFTALFSGKNVASDPLFQSASQSAVLSGAREFEDGDNRFIGSYFKPGYDLLILARTSWDDAMRGAYSLLLRFVILGGAAVGAAILFALGFARHVTAPLRKLYEATTEVAQGNFSAQVQIRSSDEIGALSSSFNTMSNRIQDLLTESIERVRIEGELAIASTVQKTLLPPPEFRNESVHIYSHYKSASECGGDWWGFFEVGDKIVLLIADATGHGLPSALITAAARSCFSVLHRFAEATPTFPFSPGNLLSYANRVIYESASGTMMMTLFAGIVDFSTGRLTYASAGHNPPWLFQHNGTGYAMKSLHSRGIRLGETAECSDFEEKWVPIRPHDLLFLYTDGIMEGKNKHGEMYGKRQVKKTIEENIAGGPELIVKSLMRDFRRHNEDKPLDDDITLVATMILPPSH